jgi:hypothetical protein
VDVTETLALPRASRERVTAGRIVLGLRGRACNAARSIEKWFKRPTPHDDRNQFERVVQDEDIGDGAANDPASICEPEIVGGDGRRASRRFPDREADGDEIAEGLDHGQAGAGERTVRQPHAVVAFSHLLAAELIVAIRHTGGGSRVGDRVRGLGSHAMRHGSRQDARGGGQG